MIKSYINLILLLVVLSALFVSDCQAWRRRRRSPHPVHCAVHGWSTWAKCSKTCGSGTTTRNRKVARYPAHGGNKCPSLSERKSCYVWNCPINCQMSSWSTWTDCSGTCGSGFRTRSISVIKKDKYGGTKCPAARNERQDCTNEKHCPIDCLLGEWEYFGRCSVTCGNGIELYAREITKYPAHGGKLCGDLQERRKCYKGVCPVDCVSTEWGAWGPCSASCDEGKITRTRKVTVPSVGSGDKCGHLKEQESCVIKNCPVDCQVSAWSSFMECSTTCGSGQQQRTRVMTQKATYGGKTCSHLSEKQDCNFGPCPIDCQVSSWSNVGPCTKSCGGGIQHRLRTVLKERKYGGKDCPSQTGQSACNTQECDGRAEVACKIGNWNAWTRCSKKCGRGNNSGWMTRTRWTRVKPDGTPCGTQKQKKRCNRIKCSNIKAKDFEYEDDDAPEEDLVDNDISDSEEGVRGVDYEIVNDDGVVEQ